MGSTLRLKILMPGLRTTRTLSLSPKHHQAGVSIVEFAIIIPVVIVLAAVAFDLARLYINALYARQIVVMGAKLSHSSNPAGYAFLDSDLNRFYRAPENEEQAVTDKRTGFWRRQLDPDDSEFWGLTYFPAKDKKVLNLMHGYLTSVSPRVYFPIPEPLDESTVSEELGARVNCSITLRFAPGSEPPLQSTWPAEEEAQRPILIAQRDRLLRVKCAVPLTGLRILSFNQSKYYTVEAEAYAYRAGNIRP